MDINQKPILASPKNSSLLMPACILIFRKIMPEIMPEISLWAVNNYRKNILVKRIVDVLPRHHNAFLPHSPDPPSNPLLLHLHLPLPLHFLPLHLLHPICKLLFPLQALPDFSQASKHYRRRWLLNCASLSDKPFPDLNFNRYGLAFLWDAYERPL